MNDFYHSYTFGDLSLVQVKGRILDFISSYPQYKYRLVVGTDSQPKNGQGTDFITAIVIHRIGVGGIYFWKRLIEKKTVVFKTRIYQEALLSLGCAQDLLDEFKDNGISKYDMEIHVDIGNFGQTREIISEIVGMIRGSGFTVKTKPDSYCASKVADRHT